MKTGVGKYKKESSGALKKEKGRSESSFEYFPSWEWWILSQRNTKNLEASSPSGLQKSKSVSGS